MNPKNEKQIPKNNLDVKLSWTAPEFVQHERGTAWKVLMSSAVTALFVYGLMTDGWTFSLAIAVLTGVYVAMHRQKPKHHTVKVTELGIKVGNKNYPYSRIVNFWILYEPPYLRELHLQVNGDFFYTITLQLGPQDPVELKKELSKHIPELKGKKEGLARTVVRLLKL